MIRKMAIEDFNPSAEMTIWDVRDEAAYRAGHIACAVNHPVDSLNAELLANANDPVYVLCGGGTKAVRACELLNELDDSRDIVLLTGGTRGAAAAGWKLVSENE